MPHKFNIGAVVYYRPKDRMLNVATTQSLAEGFGVV